MRSLYKIFFVWFGMMTLLLSAAEHDALSERSAGRILCVQMHSGYHFFVFVRPMPMDTWLCREYLSGKEVEVYPKKLEIMPFFDQNDDFAIETFTVWHILHPRTAEYRRYCAFAPLVNLSRVSRTRHFVEMVHRQQREIVEARQKVQASMPRVSPQNCCGSTNQSAQGSASLGAEISGSVDRDVLAQAVANAVAALILDGEVLPELDSVLQSQDYFLAVEFFRYYREQVFQWLSLGSASERTRYEDVVQKFNSIARTLVTNYRLDREKNRQLEEDFARVCPKQRGLWKQGIPVTFDELLKLNAAAFASWEKSRELSPDCDFPEWGSHTLDILAMMPGNNGNDPIVLQFKDALKNYQNAFADGVN